MCITILMAEKAAPERYATSLLYLRPTVEIDQGAIVDNKRLGRTLVYQSGAEQAG
jgi:hypothetical protein